jgi:hypothetical protein
MLLGQLTVSAWSPRCWVSRSTTLAIFVESSVEVVEVGLLSVVTPLPTVPPTWTWAEHPASASTTKPPTTDSPLISSAL